MVAAEYRSGFKLQLLLAFAAVYIIWGSTYLGIRYAIESMPPFSLAGLRHVVGGAIFFVFAYWRDRQLPKTEHIIPALIVGTLMVVGGNGLVCYAEVTVPSGLTALMVAMVPLWVTLFDWIRPGGTRPSILVLAAVFVGLGGVALLIDPLNASSGHEINLVGALAVVGATLLWGIGSVYSRYSKTPGSPLTSASLQMFLGGIVAMVVSGLTGELGAFDLTAVTTGSWVAFWYLTLLGSLAFAAYIWLLRNSTPAKAATYAYVNPIIALLLGTLLAGEPISAWTVMCSVVIIVAVVVIVTAKGRVAKTTVMDDTAPAAAAKAEPAVAATKPS